MKTHRNMTLAAAALCLALFSSAALEWRRMLPTTHCLAQTSQPPTPTNGRIAATPIRAGFWTPKSNRTLIRI